MLDVILLGKENQSIIWVDSKGSGFMNRVLYIILAVLIIGVGGFFVVNNQSGDNQNKKAVSTSQQIVSDGGQLIDVRTVEEYIDSHADDAVNIPLDKILSGNYDGIEVDKPLFVYCRSGNRSNQAKIALEKAGYNNVTDLGGLSSLQADGMIVCKTDKPSC